MGKIQVLSQKAINLSMTLGLLTTTLFSPVSMLRTTPVTAETLPNTLIPGQTIDTQTYELNTSDFINHDNYKPVYKNTTNPHWLNNNTYKFGTDKNGAGSWLPFNYAIDMREKIEIDGTTYVEGTVPTNAMKRLGDANGIILTDLSADALSKGRTGNGLGIGNLSTDSYFIGNNYSHRYDKYANGAPLFSTATVIAKTKKQTPKFSNVATTIPLQIRQICLIS